MNKNNFFLWCMTIIGLTFIAFSSLTDINFIYKIVGFVLGSFLSIYMPYRIAIVKGKFAENKLSEISAKLKFLKLEETNPEEIEKIDQIEKDLENWSKSVSSNMDVISLQIKSHYLSEKEKNAKLNVEWNYIYH